MFAPGADDAGFDAWVEDPPDTRSSVRPTLLTRRCTSYDRYPDLSPIFAYIASGAVPQWHRLPGQRRFVVLGRSEGLY
jgi:hypothetical protein